MVLFLLLAVHAELVDVGRIFAVPVYCKAHCSHNARGGSACAGVFATLEFWRTTAVFAAVMCSSLWASTLGSPLKSETNDTEIRMNLGVN